MSNAVIDRAAQQDRLQMLEMALKNYGGQTIEQQCANEHPIGYENGLPFAWAHCVQPKGHTGPCKDENGILFNYGIRTRVPDLMKEGT